MWLVLVVIVGFLAVYYAAGGVIEKSRGVVSYIVLLLCIGAVGGGLVSAIREVIKYMGRG